MADLRPSMREVAVLHESTRLILSTSADIDTVLHQVVLVVRNYFGVDHCAVFLVEPSADHIYCRVQSGYDEQQAGARFPIGKEGVTGWVAYTRMPMYVPDVTTESRYSCADPAVRSELALPLIARDELLGVLDIESRQAAYFDEQAIALLALFADQAAIAIDNAHLYSTERRRMRQIELINLIARSAATAIEVEQFLTMLAELLADSFEESNVAVFLRQADGSLRLGAHAGSIEPRAERCAAAQQQGLLAEALGHHAAVYEPTVRADRNGCFRDSGAEIALPLLSSNEVVGGIVIAHEREHFLSSDDRAIAQAASDVAATAIRSVLLADELRRVASTDFLTGVYNQRHFHTVLGQELARAKRYSKQFGLALLDLRQFSRINAVIGFDKADDLLRRTARRLAANIRANDTLCRYAGDRFALILPEVDPHRMQPVLAKLRQSLAKVQYQAGGQSHSLSAACATAHFPQDGSTDAELIRTLLERIQHAKHDAAAAGA